MSIKYYIWDFFTSLCVPNKKYAANEYKNVCRNKAKWKKWDDLFYVWQNAWSASDDHLADYVFLFTLIPYRNYYKADELSIYFLLYEKKYIDVYISSTLKCGIHWMCMEETNIN